MSKDCQESSPAPQFEGIKSSEISLLYGSTLTSIHDQWKNHSFDYMDFCQQSDVCFLIHPSRFVIAFLPGSKCLLMSLLQSLSAVILEPKKIKSLTASTFSLSIHHEVMRQDAMSLAFECWVSSQFFHSPLSPSSRGSLIALHFLPLDWYHLYIWGCWCLS